MLVFLHVQRQADDERSLKYSDAGTAVFAYAHVFQKFRDASRSWPRSSKYDRKLSDFRKFVNLLFLIHNNLSFLAFYGRVSCIHCLVLYDLQIN